MLTDAEALQVVEDALGALVDERDGAGLDTDHGGSAAVTPSHTAHECASSEHGRSLEEFAAIHADLHSNVGPGVRYHGPRDLPCDRTDRRVA